MQRKSRLSMFAALSAAALLFAAAPAKAQCGGLAASGHGTYVVPTTQNETSFVFALAEWHSGAVQGFGIWTGENATVIFRITSAMFLPAPYEGSLAAAGQIVAVIGTPDPSNYFNVGATVFFAVNDNGGAGPDENSGLSGLPPFLPPMTTIQQIVAFSQANGLYHITWRELLTGSIRIH
jgi:hypothetical protein